MIHLVMSKKMFTDVEIVNNRHIPFSFLTLQISLFKNAFQFNLQNI